MENFNKKKYINNSGNVKKKKGKEFKKKKKETVLFVLKNAVHNKNTCDYNDVRLSTE